MKLLEEGTLTNQSDLLSYPFQIVMLDESHLDLIMELQEQGMKMMEDEHFYFPITRDEQREALGNKGITLGVIVHGQLIGFHTALFPGEHEDNLGRDLGLTDEDLLRVAHLEIVYIHPFYRRNGMQRQMAEWIIQEVLRQHKYCFLYETVAPGNIPSIQNTFALNMLIVKLKLKYNGSLRYIFYRDILNPIEIDMSQMMEIPAHELLIQERLLNEGYVGFKQNMNANGAVILFAKIKDKA